MGIYTESSEPLFGRKKNNQVLPIREKSVTNVTNVTNVTDYLLVLNFIEVIENCYQMLPDVTNYFQNW